MADRRIRPRLKVGTKWVDLQDLVLYQDDHLLALNKPPGVPTLQPQSGSEPDMLSVARSQEPNLQVAHRLDRHTTGVLLFARNPATYRELAGLFARRKIQKTYFALVGKQPKELEFTVEAPIKKTAAGKPRIDFGDGKPASTHIILEKAFRRYSLLRCSPRTGRMHQVRLHLAYAGAPIVGDSLYGGQDVFLSQLKPKYRPKPDQEEQPINRQFLLHAAALAFAHPHTGESVLIEAPLSENFQLVLAKLEQFDAA